MNEQVIVGMAQPYAKDGAITYEEFERIYDMLSLREKYAVTDILYNNGIDIIANDEQIDEENFILDIDEPDEDEEAAFEILYDEGLFKDSGFKDSASDDTVFINKSIKQSNEVLCALIQKGNLQAEQDICVKNRRLVDKYVVAYEKKYRHRLDFEDLEQVGYLGLIKAAKRFDTKRGYSFTTYAVWWIKQSITREIMDHGFVIRIPVHLMERINKVSALENKYIELDQGDRIEKIAEELGYPEEWVLECIKLKSYVLTYSSLNVAVGDAEETELGEFIPDEGLMSVEEMVEQADLRRIIDSVLATLTEREERIIRLRYGLDDGRKRTLEEVGQEFHVTRERIRQIEAKALRKLRHPSRARKIKGFID